MNYEFEEMFDDSYYYQKIVETYEETIRYDYTS